MKADVLIDQTAEDEYFEMELLDFVAEICRIKTSVDQQKSPGSEKSEVFRCIITRFSKPTPMPLDQLIRLIQALNILANSVYNSPLFFIDWPLLQTMYNSMKSYRASNQMECSKAQSSVT